MKLENCILKHDEVGVKAEVALMGAGSVHYTHLAIDNMYIFELLVPQDATIPYKTLIACMRCGKLEIARFILETGFEEGNGEEDGTSLAEMASMRNVDFLLLVEEYGYDIKDEKCLWIAATKRKNCEIIQFLVSNGTKAPVGFLSNVVSWANLETVQTLVYNGCDPSEQDNEPVVRAIAPKIIKYLLDEGASVLKAAKTAAYAGNLKMLMYLQERDMSLKSNDVFLEAALGGHMDVVDHLLVDKDVKLSSQVLRNSIMSGNSTLVMKFLNAGAKADDAIIYASEYGHLDMVEMLMQRGANPRIKNGMALVVASTCGYLDVVEFLVVAGVSVATSDNDPIIGASANGHLPVVEYLFNNDANIEIGNNSPARVSAMNGHLDVLLYILDHSTNADIDVLLRIAAGYGHIDIVKHLVENCNATNGIARAIEYAQKGNFANIVEYLNKI